MLQQVRKWSIRTIRQWDGLMSKSIRFVLYRNETERLCEMDVTELRDLKIFFEHWVDPFATNNPEHVDKMK